MYRNTWDLKILFSNFVGQYSSIKHLEIGVADVFPIGRRLFLQSGHGMHQHLGEVPSNS